MGAGLAQAQVPQVAFVGSASRSDSGKARVQLTVPGAAQVNDFMLVAVVVRPGVTVTPAQTGWTVARVETGIDPVQYSFHRFVGAGDPGTTFTFNFSASSEGTGGMMVFRGVDPASPIEASSGRATAAGTTETCVIGGKSDTIDPIQAPALSAGGAPHVATQGAMLVGFFSNGQDKTKINQPPLITTTPGCTQDAPATPAWTERIQQNSGGGGKGFTLEGSYQPTSCGAGGANCTGTRTAYALNNEKNAALAQMFALRPFGLDHYAVTHATSGVNCQAENVTISAHTASHSPVAPGTTITVTARRVAGAAGNRGDWSVVAGTPANLNNGTADDGVATYTFGTGETQVVLALKDTWEQTVNIDVTDAGGVTDTSGTASQDPGYNQNLAFSAAGFRFVDGAGNPIGSQIAAVSSPALNLQAVQSTGCTTPGACTGVCQGVFANGTSVAMDLAYQCNDPVTCQAGQQLSFTNNAVTTALPANPAAGVTSYVTVPVRFGANSAAPFTFYYTDAGRISLHARYSIPLGTGTPSSNLMTGAGGPFTVKPWGFGFVNVRRTAGSFPNPGATGATGPVFAKAGEPLTLTVVAISASNNVTPNFGKEIVPEGVVINSTLPAGLGLTSNPAPGNNVIPGTEFGAGGMAADTDGRATVNNLYWGEVGIVRFSAAIADGDYLGAGNVPGGIPTGNIGRFTPADFGIAYNTPSFGAGCSAGAVAFTYVGQRFTYGTAPVMTVTARNVQGNATANYTGSWWKITNASLSGRAYTANPASVPLDTGGLPAATSDPAIVDSGGGSGTLTFNAGSGLAFQRSTPVAAFDADVSLALNVADSDGIAFSGNPARFGAATAGNGIAFSGSKQMRFGRLRLTNAYGSQALDLPVPMEAQYYRDLGGGAIGFVTNTDDSCTTIPAGAVTLSPALTTVSGAGALANGRGTLRLARLGVRGTASLCVDLDAGASGDTTCAGGTPADRSFLQGNWTGGAWDRDPRAQVTFGIYRGSPDMIFQRENY